MKNEVLGQCECCGHKRRLLHREEPHKMTELIADSKGQPLMWLCKRCARWNKAFREGKARVCMAPAPGGGR